MDDITRNTRNKECIEGIIRNTFEAIQDAYNYQTEKAPKLDSPNRQRLSRIVFPQKRDDTTRISEQELRFVFVEQLNKKIDEGWDVYYSVETRPMMPIADSAMENRRSGMKKAVLENLIWSFLITD